MSNWLTLVVMNGPLTPCTFVWSNMIWPPPMTMTANREVIWGSKASERDICRGDSVQSTSVNLKTIKSQGLKCIVLIRQTNPVSTKILNEKFCSCLKLFPPVGETTKSIRATGFSGACSRCCSESKHPCSIYLLANIRGEEFIDSTDYIYHQHWLDIHIHLIFNFLNL